MLRLALLLCVTAFAVADEVRTLVVATKIAPPFVMRDERGRWSGISVELWEDIASELNLRWEWREQTLDALLNGVADGTNDVGIAALTVTAQREGRLDFTHPYYTTGLGIAVPNRGRSLIWSVVRGLASPAFIGALLAMCGVIVVPGILIWLVEHRRNEHFSARPLHGIGDGFWWAMVTFATVGYGDKVPHTVLGRAIAVVWMFSGMALISIVTATLASSITVHGLRDQINKPSELVDQRVGVVANTTGEAWANTQKHLQQVVILPDLDAAVAALRRHDIAAIVHDRPLLRWYAHADAALEILPVTLQHQDYAIALPPGSPLLEPLNHALLERLERGELDVMLERYLGK